MKIFSVQQIRELDRYTIENEPIASIDLMERASEKFIAYIQDILDYEKPIYVFCGIGNNGGDGLAVSRLLINKGYTVKCFVVRFSKNTSKDFEKNYSRLKEITSLQNITVEADIPELDESAIIIDGIFGSGLNRAPSGIAKTVIDFINSKENYTIAIDIPSGLFANEQDRTETAIYADLTISFQLPKYPFFIAENEKHVGEWNLVDIGLSQRYIENEPSKYHCIDKNFAAELIKKRDKFSHKGTYGHVLVGGGSYGKMGAVILSSKACLKSGAGLVTAFVPKKGYSVLQTALPEVMVETCSSKKKIDSFNNINFEKYNAVAIGLGLGTDNKTNDAFKKLLTFKELPPLILDADALNILSKDKSLMSSLPRNTILTPHPGEFDRLFEKSNDGYKRIEKQLQYSMQYGIYIVLKGAHTSISTPEGEVYFNSTGNSGMATAGSGDVLTGIIAGLVAQNYTTLSSCLLGVFIHGKAGDVALASQSEESLNAMDIIQNLGRAFKAIKENRG